MQNESYKVVGLGELIWDLLPSGRQLGGAPSNFAYIARLLGEDAAVASRVGRDALGREALARLDAVGIDARYVQTDDEHPTGTVGVQLDERGEPHFNVNDNSAWDYLEWTDDWAALASRADAVCFGTLGQRREQAREVILRFLRHTRPAALRVFDVNLRHSFFGPSMLDASLRLASVLKLNADELPLLTTMLEIAGQDEERAALRLIERYDLSLVALTRGARGSLLVTKDESCEHTGYSVRVADTIGAGDAFAAALTHKLLRRATLTETSAAANRAGAWVASRTGATPPAEPGELLRTVNSEQ